MEHVVKAPLVGESITEVRILKWLKGDGSAVKSGDLLVEIETDKASVEVAAETSGALKILTPEGQTVPVGGTLAVIDDSKTGSAGSAVPTKTAPVAEATSAVMPSSTAKPLASSGAWSERDIASSHNHAIRRMANQMGVSVDKMAATAGSSRLRKEDLLKQISGQVRQSSNGTVAPIKAQPTLKMEHVDRPGDRRVEMTRIRTKISERLVYAQQTAAILTTFNEVDLSKVMALRNQHKDSFQKIHGAKLGFMSFFARACVLALKEFPEVNASIDGKDIVYHDYYDIGVAVGTERGLVVPVLRGVENMTVADIEKGIAVFAEKAKTNKISLQDMEGGTFTISNGGTYGSLLSTPILNPPQSGILGMHKIQERPVVENGQIVIRPMMYLALSYDHRLIDGKGAVSFLVKIRTLLENPETLQMELS